MDKPRWKECEHQGSSRDSNGEDHLIAKLTARNFATVAGRIVHQTNWTLNARYQYTLSTKQFVQSYFQDLYQSPCMLLQQQETYRMTQIRNIAVPSDTSDRDQSRDFALMQKMRHHDISSYPQPKLSGMHSFNIAILEISLGKNQILRKNSFSLEISDTYDTPQCVCLIPLESIHAENELITTSWVLCRAPEGSYIIVLEYAELGELREYLKEKFAEITWKEKINICRQKNILTILSGKRETPVPGTPCEYIEIYRRCWDEDPNRRPSVHDVFERLGEKIMVTGPIFKEQEKCCENHPHRELTPKWLETRTSETDSISSLSSTSN
ncbi:360_t:CDS:2, partial [Acaulospora morrowiae]